MMNRIECLMLALSDGNRKIECVVLCIGEKWIVIVMLVRRSNGGGRSFMMEDGKVREGKESEKVGKRMTLKS